VTRQCRILIPTCLSLLTAVETRATEPDFTQWINDQVHAAVTQRFSQRSPSKQTETPSQDVGSSTLVDQSSAADLMGVALDLGKLALDRDKAPDSGAASVTAYAIYAAVKGVDPLNPQFYAGHRGWRQLSTSLGFSKGKPASGEIPATKDSISVGLKYLVIDKRDPNDETNRSSLAAVDRAMQDAVGPTAAAILAVRHVLRARLGLEESELNSVLDSGPQFAAARQKLTPQDLEAIDAALKPAVTALTLQEGALQAAFDEIRKRPQLSVGVLSRFEKDAAAVHDAGLIFQYGLAKRLDLTLNGGVELRRKDGRTLWTERVAGQLQLTVIPEGLFSLKKPTLLHLSADGKWPHGEKSMIRGQLKLTVPVKEGVELPLSFTIANRGEHTPGRDLGGQMSLAVDIARLLAQSR